MNRSLPRVSRRSFLAVTAGTLAAPMVVRPARAATNSVKFVSYGGSYQDALARYVMKPFAEETGIKVGFVPAPELAKIKAQLLTGNVDWDIFTGPRSRIIFGSKQGFWQKLDLSLFDVDDLAIAPQSDNIASVTYSTGITWDPEKYGPGQHPVNFVEYFDIKKFPGRRILRNSPDLVLELALLSAGVLPENMYPLDLNRAFEALDKMKSSAVRVDATPQAVSLVQNGEVDFSYTYSNRVKATTESGGGKPLAYSFEQNLISSEGVAVLKDAPNKESAMKLIAYYLRPDVQAKIVNETAVGPVSKNAQKMLSAEAQKWQSSLSNTNNLLINDTYWADNFEGVSRRFKEWMLG
ncbi:ABC transporter substrate-binding protein [Bradyrhizobium sp. CCGB12]|uniref:ABC transporter substrate-binding protein n=1 Tax=Bradyrhizobium sp. CCGB12 TaxID=2949632 RepID=UPI0020B24F43|nr:ABC transporter substrate-binding protein [Bradyrhizobium sp. CCGB12]MCP3392261.1 ABC transporter substrate-binding protein [Bradyrhizobium sp. CCGB12]